MEAARVVAATAREKHATVVCFGAGFVAGPLVQYLLRDGGIAVCVAAVVPGEAEALCAKYRHMVGRRGEPPLLTSRVVDVMDELAYGAVVDELCAQADCVVALVPEPAQLRIAQACINAKTKLVTASYPSPGIKALATEAKKAGVSILCEMGLDPGMDHMISMKIINEIKSNGGKVMEFSSVCGGLPAPDSANNPIRYKFSWSPIGALRAAQRPAKYLQNGSTITVKGDAVLGEAKPSNLFPRFDLEEIPNGDSIPYARYYSIPDVRSMFRGTLRFKGFCSVIHECVQLGLVNESDAVSSDTPWAKLIDERLQRVGKPITPETKQFLEWLQLTSNASPIGASPSVMHAFCNVLLDKLSFNPGERDLVLMYVGVRAEYPDGSVAIHEARFEELGEPHGDTIMAKTVGLTAAIGVKLLLEGKIKAVGLLSPTSREIYEPSLKLLADEGIHFQERRRFVEAAPKPRL